MKGALLFLGICVVSLFNPFYALVLVGLLLTYEIYLQNSKTEETDWDKFWKKETDI